MADKIRVYGKAQNRTALGIAHAYLVMNPAATLEDLRKVFPDSLSPDNGVKELFLPLDEAQAFNTKMSLYFTKPDEVFELMDGSVVAMAQVWSKPSFENMIRQGSLYAIDVAEFEKSAHPGQKGGYRLEYLNGYVPPVVAAAQPAKKSKRWIWLLLLPLIAAGIVLFLVLGRKDASEPKVVTQIVEKEVVVRDTVYLEKIEDIERDFNAAQFEVARWDLNDDAKIALHDLAKVLNQNPQLRLSIVGHTSAEGDTAGNRILSERRAKAAVDFLVHKEGVDSTRLKWGAMGSSELKDPANPNGEVNRRTEFQVLD